MKRHEYISGLKRKTLVFLWDVWRVPQSLYEESNDLNDCVVYKTTKDTAYLIPFAEGGVGVNTVKNVRGEGVVHDNWGRAEVPIDKVVSLGELISRE